LAAGGSRERDETFFLAHIVEARVCGDGVSHERRGGFLIRWVFRWVGELLGERDESGAQGRIEGAQVGGFVFGRSRKFGVQRVRRHVHMCVEEVTE